MQVLTGVVIVGALAAAVYFRGPPAGTGGLRLRGRFPGGGAQQRHHHPAHPRPGGQFGDGRRFQPLAGGYRRRARAGAGELSGYLLGYSGQTLIADRPIYTRIQGWMRRWGVWVIFALAIIPNPVFDVGGMIAGALRFPLWKFLSSCAIGKIIKNIAFALAGYYGIEAILRLLGQ